jgi:hypothetical protein
MMMTTTPPYIKRVVVIINLQGTLSRGFIDPLRPWGALGESTNPSPASSA